MEFKAITYAKDAASGILTITINRPEARNALSMTARQDIKNAVAQIEQDKDLRVVIITGAGDKSFISGADISVFKDAAPPWMEEYASTLGQQLYTDIENTPVPVIAMINGYCFGGGLELALCCDIRIASTSARFGQLEVNLGFIPGGGNTQRLPRLIGWGRAKEMIYTGRILEAAEAERIGLVDRVVAPDRLEAEVRQLAESIASKSPAVIRMAKKVINQGMYTDLAAGLACEKANFALCFSTEDTREGVNAFLEKRKPDFKGR